MNFGDYFCHCINILYIKIDTYVTNNGHFSEFFEPSRGIRQGCPILAYLFIIIVEFLANTIRKNPKIQGIKINGIEFKILQYADYTCLFLSDTKSQQAALQTIKFFTTCSGLKINMDKSEALWIGASSNYRHKPNGLTWTDDTIKTLGVHIGTDMQRATDQNFKECLERIKNLLDLWCLRKLTLKGKVLIVNTLIIPIMIYPCSVIHPPKWVITSFKNKILTFAWNGKPAKVKYTAMINEIHN
jgi:hypothetical protein